MRHKIDVYFFGKTQITSLKKLSSRTHHLVQSDIRAVTRMINEAGGINLGQGICDLPTPDAIKEGAHRAIDENPFHLHSYGRYRLT